MIDYIEPLQKLVDKFRKLPGVGGKTAVRLAFAVLNMSEEDANEFSEAIVGAKRDIHSCEICGNISMDNLCPICKNPERNNGIICVVEDARDVMSFERIREFQGKYHVLGGVLSPINGIGPEQLRIRQLIERIESEDVKEIIIATNPTVEGEATAMYLAKIFNNTDINISRLAYGVPVGADLEYADEVTLNRALEGRRSMK